MRYARSRDPSLRTSLEVNGKNEILNYAQVCPTAERADLLVITDDEPVLPGKATRAYVAWLASSIHDKREARTCAGRKLVLTRVRAAMTHTEPAATALASFFLRLGAQ